MAITYLVGDATVPQTEGPAVIAHICNDIGGWGRGFVLALSARWREPEAYYRGWYAGRWHNGFALGAVQFVEVGPQLWVANMVAQHDTKTVHGVPPIRYYALQEALFEVAEFADKHSASVHMPRIGCSLAGGNWAQVGALVQHVLADEGVRVFVYDLPDAAGL